jgi:hypothetical protein
MFRAADELPAKLMKYEAVEVTTTLRRAIDTFPRADPEGGEALDLKTKPVRVPRVALIRSEPATGSAGEASKMYPPTEKSASEMEMLPATAVLESFIKPAGAVRFAASIAKSELLPSVKAVCSVHDCKMTVTLTSVPLCTTDRMEEFLTTKI